MTTNQQTEQNEIGRRIARHAASYCADRGDFASASIISRAWGIAWWRLFLTVCTCPACWAAASGG